MAEIVNIEYQNSKGKDCKLSLEIRDIDKFRDFIADTGIANLEGEELVSAILETAREHISSANIFKGLLRHNGPKGEPAMMYFYPNGNLALEKRYKHDVNTNGKNGEPAEREFYEDGNVMKVIYREKGAKQDPEEGVPAWQKFSQNGILVNAKSYKKDKMVKQFSAEECKQYVQRTSRTKGASPSM